MSAAIALKAARDTGIELQVDGINLLLEASTPPPAAVLDLLSAHKAEVIALLRPDRDGWSVEELPVFFDERAGIAEFDGGLDRAEAEVRAFAACVAEWLDHNPVNSRPGNCLACGIGDCPGDGLLPFGTEQTGHAWLHSRCWPAWHAVRKAEAVAALRAMGICPQAGFPDDFGKNGDA